MIFRVGQGFDVHRFEEGRELYLGGVKIDHTGLAGHSDADVLIHAVIDALLGASALGDIGELFPDKDPEFKNIRSTLLLENVVRKLNDNNWLIENIDVTVICETPKISLYRELIREQISKITGIGTDRIMVKGKTTEKLGFTGRGEGIVAMAVTLLKKEE
ncbi:MAG TPA: 2-C-methyl-D-erythritol 2,4-cyclodiphosphate synthase [bacterium]|jgi:2-C-methyl-D-erythritol 2,4-cyclodiphosphate synthase|nr:2-C-methyl-D-erythritol 2,4-cyclodiphosphate synthase [bacterium]HOB71584.1 2-C-methyl-D-erythritol 2,4-cyclodiphosphate synthase [bacterium]HPM45935.1 2-C-methyl-D-erythritol 2,4-cyclodiphosphate synthase [bacterium]HQM84489.1 2-C-methyl-D-erythritol 2,4-cyclodiphosphate synthase [bacterium]HRQ68873.1 2-C-methyl-D-erythritol 2,4-cyclodiphosphate synthase [bacterium]